MKTWIAPNEATIRRLAERLKVARKRSEFQRIQCILIRATLGSSAAEIAQLLGWSVATVHMLHSRYTLEGDALFDLKAKGGRRNHHMTLEEEAEFLAPFLGSAAKGGILVVLEIQVAFEARIGRAVPPARSIACWPAMTGARLFPSLSIPRLTRRRRPLLKNLETDLAEFVARESAKHRSVRLMFQDEGRLGLLDDPR